MEERRSVAGKGGGGGAKHFGLVGALMGMAMGGFECPSCGPVAKSDFPAEVQSQMSTNSAVMVIGALVLFAAVIALIVAIN